MQTEFLAGLDRSSRRPFCRFRTQHWKFESDTLGCFDRKHEPEEKQANHKQQSEHEPYQRQPDVGEHNADQKQSQDRDSDNDALKSMEANERDAVVRFHEQQGDRRQRREIAGDCSGPLAEISGFRRGSGAMGTNGILRHFSAALGTHWQGWRRHKNSGMLSRPARSVLLSASVTDSINLKRVPSRQVAILLTDFPLKIFKAGRKEFDRTAALGAHHVVMASAVVLMLEAGDPIVKSDHAGKAAIGQEFQCAVNRGVTDARVLFFHQAVEFVGRKMFPRLQERAKNRVALLRLFQTHALEMVPKDVFRFAHHRAGDCRLIVNTLLKHEKK
jgi:hypothetical protein